MNRDSFEFGPYLLNGNDLTLWEHGEKCPLNLKYVAVLHYLICHSGKVISKQELFDSVWKDAFVSDSALTQAIKEIRKALKEQANHPKYIKTLPKRGYQFQAQANQESRALNLFKSSFQTYKQGDYILSTDMLQMLLSYSKNWGIDQEGQQFLCESCLGNGLAIPAWLGTSYQGIQKLLQQAFQSDSFDRQLAALHSADPGPDEWILEHIPSMLFKKQNRYIQRACVKVLVQRFGAEFVQILYLNKPSGLQYWWNYLIALALARDEDKKNIHFTKRTISATLFILLSLAWVRIRREKACLAGHILGGTCGSSLAGGLTGAISGCFLFKLSPFFLPSLTMIGLFLGACIGFALASGFFISQTVAQRHSALWSVPCTIMASLTVVSLFQLGSYSLFHKLLQIPAFPRTDWKEMALLSIAISCSGLLFSKSVWKSASIAALTAGLAGFLMNLWDGNLFIRSTLNFLATLIPDDSMIEMMHASPIRQALLNPIEASLLGFFLFLGAFLFNKTGPDQVV